jgi:hypothetical protein
MVLTYKYQPRLHPQIRNVKGLYVCLPCIASNKARLLKLYNDKRNAQVLNLFIYLLLPYMFRDFLKPETYKAEVNR